MINLFKKALISGIIISLAFVPLTASSAPEKKMGEDTYKIIREGEEIARFNHLDIQFITYWWDEDIWTCQISIISLECWAGKAWTDNNYERD